jgi:hypothetical protein
LKGKDHKRVINICSSFNRKRATRKPRVAKVEGRVLRNQGGISQKWRPFLLRKDHTRRNSKTTRKKSRWQKKIKKYLSLELQEGSPPYKFPKS